MLNKVVQKTDFFTPTSHGRVKMRLPRIVRRISTLLAGVVTSLLVLQQSVSAIVSTTDVMYSSNYAANGSISKIGPNGAVTPFATGLADAEGIAADSSGNLYVALQMLGQIDKITPAGSVSTFISGLPAGVAGLAFDGSQNLYVAIQSGMVDKISPSGSVSTLASLAVTYGNTGIQGLAIDSHGNVFVAAYSLNDVLEIAPNGSSSVFASGITQPSGVAFDKAGNLYVGSSAASIVEEYNSSAAGTLFASVPNGVWGLNFDSAGNLFVGSNALSDTSISEVTPGGTVSTYASGLPGNPLYITDPAAVVPEPAGLSIVLVGAISMFRLSRRLRIRAA